MKRGIPLLAILFVALLALGSGLTFTASAAHPTQNSASVGVAQPAQGSAPSQQDGKITGPFISQAVKSDVSPRLSTLPITQENLDRRDYRETEKEPGVLPGYDQPGPQIIDSVLQKITSPLVMPTPIVNVEGQINYWGVYPPDTVGDVGPNHYVQMVNSTGVLVLDKAGTRLGGPYNFNELFRGFGGLCESNQNGDPIVLHDQMADRWFLSQFAFSSQSGPTFQCFAISTSPDPLGSYYRYAFETATVGFDDYPHYGVWPDAYYFAANRFNAPGFAGAVGAFERQRMIEGDPSARMVIFLNPNNGGHLPSDMDGGMLPPPGSPNYYLFPTNASTGTISEYKFHVDWSNPALSTFTGPFPIQVAPWDFDLCPAAREACIPQPNTTVRLEAIADRFMHRLAYRNFGTHESLVTKHTVDADGSGRAGVRWYEIRDPNGSRTVHQQSTYAPADGHHRWMGSIAMDRQGNMAVGYSISSSTLFPSIRYAGRLATDPLSEFTQGEGTLITGGGSETGPAGRWGDYSSMNIDPRDDCTFWYTTEYFNVTGLVNWKTRIGSFRFPGCVGGTATPVATSTAPVPPTLTVQPSPTSCPGGISTTGSITTSDPSQVGAVVGGVASSCGVTAICPGQSSIPDPRHFDSYTLTNNSGAPQCVTVRIDASACSEAGVGSVAYLGSFDPNMVCTNYLASSGSNGPRYNYSFTVPAGATYVVVVRELSPGSGCASYNINISPCAGGTATPTSIATNTVPPTMTGTPTATVVCGMQPNWVAGPSRTPARYAVQGAVANDGKFYIAGGQTPNNTPVADAARYNPVSNAWESIPPLPAAAGQISLGAEGGRVYVAGGWLGGSTITNTLRIFDIAANTWSFGAPMPAAVEAAAGVALNGKFYVIGGDDFNVALRSMYIYDIASNTWSTGPQIPDTNGRTNTYATAANGKVYVYGGAYISGTSTIPIDNLIAYDPATNSWSTLASSNSAGNGNYGAISPYGTDRLIATVGGNGSFTPSNLTRIYTISTNTWANGPNTIQPHLGHAQGTLQDGRVIVYSGLITSSAGTANSELLSQPMPCTTPSTTPTTQPSSTATRTVTTTSTAMPSGTAMPSMTSTTMATGTMMPTGTMMATGTAMATRTAVPCQGRVTVCHRTGNGNSHTISISCAALNAHLNHGDTLGSCPTSTRTPRANPFRDISTGDYFYEHTLDLRYDQAIGGYNDGTFRPYNQATRAQLVKIVVLAFHMPLYNGNAQQFSDVPTDHPFYQHIMTAWQRNIISGYNDGTFRPYANVTRGQIAKIAVESAGMAILTPTTPSFTDVPADHTFYKYIETAYANGILSGYADGKFRPEADATRGQITKIVNLATHPTPGPTP